MLSFKVFQIVKNVCCVMLGCNIICSCTYTVLEPKVRNLKCPSCGKKESEDLGPLSAFNLEATQLPPPNILILCGIAI